ncbi:MlaC/ttg2D family ABC transporter substrate-binding protein [Ponticaulis profundi]|uniref:Phospholipid-binding protein MlaC n=1 Tax=Ponticaulis profundi TaxID=2665222 RepID=A0ABW1S5L2_9PROT
MKKLLSGLLLSASLVAGSALPGFADAETEAYVEKNADMALQTLNDPKLSGPERREEFAKLMDQFTDLDLIAMRVLGKYYNRFSDKEKAAFTEAFREYGLATYEAELDKYRGSDIVVTGSQDSEPSTYTLVDSIVETVIDLPENDLPVKWRVVKFRPGSNYAKVFGEGYKVVEVGIQLDGGFFWLAGQQKEQFQDILDRNGGRSDALIAKIKEMTDRLNAEAASRRAALSGAIQAG